MLSKFALALALGAGDSAIPIATDAAREYAWNGPQPITQPALAAGTAAARPHQISCNEPTRFFCNGAEYGAARAIADAVATAQVGRPSPRAGRPKHLYFAAASSPAASAS